VPDDQVSYTSGEAPPVPAGLEAIKRTFGDCLSPDWAKRSLATFDLPYPLVYGTAMVRRATGHRLLVPVFQAVFADLKYRGLMERATHYGGIYNHRLIRGGTRNLSTHSWGIAIDMNPNENRLGTPGRMDPGVIECFEKHGLLWGGRFHRLDPMHFQYATGY
jgi:hypothetical protein